MAQVVIFTDSKGRKLQIDRFKQLNQMTDHDLLVQLHERMDNHLNEHASDAARGRWLTATLVAVLGAVATAGLLIR